MHINHQIFEHQHAYKHLLAQNKTTNYQIHINHQLIEEQHMLMQLIKAWGVKFCITLVFIFI